MRCEALEVRVLQVTAIDIDALERRHQRIECALACNVLQQSCHTINGSAGSAIRTATLLRYSSRLECHGTKELVDRHAATYLRISVCAKCRTTSTDVAPILMPLTHQIAGSGKNSIAYGDRPERQPTFINNSTSAMPKKLPITIQ
jgi:hypothetical protein